MLRSLVGSEMCIRDSLTTVRSRPDKACPPGLAFLMTKVLADAENKDMVPIERATRVLVLADRAAKEAEANLEAAVRAQAEAQARRSDAKRAAKPLSEAVVAAKSAEMSASYSAEEEAVRLGLEVSVQKTAAAREAAAKMRVARVAAQHARLPLKRLTRECHVYLRRKADLALYKRFKSQDERDRKEVTREAKQQATIDKRVAAAAKAQQARISRVQKQVAPGLRLAKTEVDRARAESQQALAEHHRVLRNVETVVLTAERNELVRDGNIDLAIHLATNKAIAALKRENKAPAPVGGGFKGGRDSPKRLARAFSRRQARWDRELDRVSAGAKAVLQSQFESAAERAYKLKRNQTQAARDMLDRAKQVQRDQADAERAVRELHEMKDRVKVGLEAVRRETAAEMSRVRAVLARTLQQLEDVRHRGEEVAAQSEMRQSGEKFHKLQKRLAVDEQRVSVVRTRLEDAQSEMLAQEQQQTREAREAEQQQQGLRDDLEDGIAALKHKTQAALLKIAPVDDSQIKGLVRDWELKLAVNANRTRDAVTAQQARVGSCRADVASARAGRERASEAVRLGQQVSRALAANSSRLKLRSEQSLAAALNASRNGEASESQGPTAQEEEAADLEARRREAADAARSARLSLKAKEDALDQHHRAELLANCKLLDGQVRLRLKRAWAAQAAAALQRNAGVVDRAESATATTDPASVQPVPTNVSTSSSAAEMAKAFELDEALAEVLSKTTAVQEEARGYSQRAGQAVAAAMAVRDRAKRAAEAEAAAVVEQAGRFAVRFVAAIRNGTAMISKHPHARSQPGRV
eukprot:TRINITY_DN17911_c0_g1_i1.p1 TRINITY_DN17911_c0_g1~~TRINITY_DN17911_c0_g1_i1.p1  ORF type:complete len:811 (+),score=274.48 TRINITY_DN17911_c0_g1_i1:98-2530(+)